MSITWPQMPVASDCGTIFIFSQKETGNRDPGLLPQTTYASLNRQWDLCSLWFLSLSASRWALKFIPIFSGWFGFSACQPESPVQVPQSRFLFYIQGLAKEIKGLSSYHGCSSQRHGLLQLGSLDLNIFSSLCKLVHDWLLVLTLFKDLVNAVQPPVFN